ncbi:MAG: YceI family protein [Sphingomonadales bacterium]|nr:YceI family protein [Sphingomonadales bacterium]
MIKKLPLALATAALAIALPLTAQPAMQKPGSPSTAAITGGTYQSDPHHTLVRWSVDHMGFTPYTGLFGDVTGTLQLDPKRPAAAKVDVTIPVSSITTVNHDLMAHLLRAPAKEGAKPDFFGPNPAPAHYVSTSVKLLGKNRAQIMGNLTLNGVTRPVVLDASFYGAGKTPAMMGGKENVGFTARTAIKRSDFGIAFAIPIVSDEVALEIAAAFAK